MILCCRLGLLELGATLGLQLFAGAVFHLDLQVYVRAILRLRVFISAIDAEQQRYSKRRYVFNKIKERLPNYQGGSIDERLRRAALAMDIERGAQSVDKYLKSIKKVDPTTKPRRGKRKAANAL